VWETLLDVRRKKRSGRLPVMTDDTALALTEEVTRQRPEVARSFQAKYTRFNFTSVVSSLLECSLWQLTNRRGYFALAVRNPKRNHSLTFAS